MGKRATSFMNFHNENLFLFWIDPAGSDSPAIKNDASLKPLQRLNSSLGALFCVPLA
jgi:hypothetical protein